MGKYTYIRIDSDNRIISETVTDYSATGFGILVDAVPNRDIMDYKYINGQYVYDPLPKSVKPDPQPTVEDRIADCELVLAEIMGGAI